MVKGTMGPCLTGNRDGVGRRFHILGYIPNGMILNSPADEVNCNEMVLRLGLTDCVPHERGIMVMTIDGRIGWLYDYELESLGNDAQSR